MPFKSNKRLKLNCIIRNFENQKTQLDKQQKAELEGKGVDIRLLNEYRKALDELNKLLQQIETDRNDVIKYERCGGDSLL